MILKNLFDLRCLLWLVFNIFFTSFLFLREVIAENPLPEEGDDISQCALSEFESSLDRPVNASDRKEILEDLKTPGFCYHVALELINNTNQVKKLSYSYARETTACKTAALGESDNNAYINSSVDDFIGTLKFYKDQCSSVSDNESECCMVARNVADEIVKRWSGVSENSNLLEIFAKEYCGLSGDQAKNCIHEPELDIVFDGCCLDSEVDLMQQNADLEVRRFLNADDLTRIPYGDGFSFVLMDESEKYTEKFKEKAEKGYCDTREPEDQGLSFVACAVRHYNSYLGSFSDSDNWVHKWEKIVNYYSPSYDFTLDPELIRLMDYHDHNLNLKVLHANKKKSFKALLALSTKKTSPAIASGELPSLQEVTTYPYQNAINERVDEISAAAENYQCDEEQILFSYIMSNWQYLFLFNKLATDNVGNNIFSKLYTSCTLRPVYTNENLTVENLENFFSDVSENGMYNAYPLLPIGSSFDEEFQKLKKQYVLESDYQKFYEYFRTASKVEHGRGLPDALVTQMGRFVNLSQSLDLLSDKRSWLKLYSSYIQILHHLTAPEIPVIFETRYVSRSALDAHIDEIERSPYVDLRDLGELYAYSDDEMCQIFFTCDEKERIWKIFYNKIYPHFALKADSGFDQVRKTPYFPGGDSFYLPTGAMKEFVKWVPIPGYGSRAYNHFLIKMNDFCNELNGYNWPLWLGYQLFIDPVWEGLDQTMTALTGQNNALLLE